MAIPPEGSSTPPSTPGTNNISQSEAEAQANASLSNSPFARMFPGGATPQELRIFLNNFLKMMIFEFKQADAAWKEGQDQLKKSIEGEE